MYINLFSLRRDHIFKFINIFSIGNRQKGCLIIHAVQVDVGQKESLYLNCQGLHLDKKDFFGKSDPFLEFYRLDNSTTNKEIIPKNKYLENHRNSISDKYLSNNGFSTKRYMIHRTEILLKTLNPQWKSFEISLQHLCEGDKNR